MIASLGDKAEWKPGNCKGGWLFEGWNTSDKLSIDPKFWKLPGKIGKRNDYWLFRHDVTTGRDIISVVG